MNVRNFINYLEQKRIDEFAVEVPSRRYNWTRRNISDVDNKELNNLLLTAIASISVSLAAPLKKIDSAITSLKLAANNGDRNGIQSSLSTLSNLGINTNQMERITNRMLEKRMSESFKRN